VVGLVREFTVSFPSALSSISSHLFTEESSCYPDLLEAGVEELVAGLENRAYTSVDLTKVRHVILQPRSKLTNAGLYYED
jgi:hypothetical protein